MKKKKEKKNNYIVANSKTQVVTKLKNSNFDNKKINKKTESSNCDKKLKT